MQPRKKGAPTEGLNAPQNECCNFALPAAGIAAAVN
jgi:hypothetical protein